MSIAAIMGTLGGASGPSIALVQQSVGSSADGSVPLIIPFGSAVVAGAEIGAANGTYTYSGQHNGKPYFNKAGTDPTLSSIAFGLDEGFWYLTDDGGSFLYDLENPSLALPWLGEWSGGTVAPTVTCSSPVTAGNSVMCQIAFDPSKVEWAVNPVMVGGGETQLTQGVANEAGNNIWVYSYYRTDATITGGETGVTFTVNSAIPVAVNISEWSGLADAGPEDADTNSGMDDAPTQSAALAPTSPSNLCIASYATVGDNYDSGPTGGWTRMTPANVTGIFLETAYLVQAAADPASTSWGLDSSVDWTAIGCVFGGS